MTGLQGYTPGNPVRPTKEIIAAIAAVAHDANRRYCLTIGDDSQPEWEDAPLWQKDSAVEGARAIAEGRVKVPQDSHANWSKHKLAEGWKYGPTKDPEKKEHPCLVPFAELPPEQQAKDRLFFGIVKALLGSDLVAGNGEAEAKTRNYCSYIWQPSPGGPILRCDRDAGHQGDHHNAATGFAAAAGDSSSGGDPR